MSSDVDLFCTHIYGESGLTENKPVEVHQISGHASARWVVPPPYIWYGRVSGHAIAVCCNTRCGCKPIYPASYPCTTNSKAVEISRKLRGTRSLDGYRDADILHSSSRRAGPCESASLHSCTGGSAPRPALSAVDILCNKMAPNDLYGKLAGIHVDAIPRAAPGCVHASPGADGALHALGYLSCNHS